MADALRSLLAEFVVEIDKAGALKRGNVEVEALKDRLHELQTVMNAIRTPAAKAAKTVQDVFARAAQQAQTNLAAIQARSFTGRADNNGFAAAGLIRARVEADKAANSIGVRFRTALLGAGQGVRGLGTTLAAGGKSLIGGLTSLRAGLIGLATGAVARFTMGLLDSIGGIGEAAAKLGVTNAEFQRLDVLAKQNATSVEALGTAFRTLGKQASDPTKDSAAAFKELGVQTKDSAGQLKSRQDLFFETAGALADVSSETQRAALAQQLLGRSGTEMLPMLAAGRAGLDAQREALMKMAVVSDDAIKRADDFGDNLEILKTELLAGLAPALVKLIPLFRGAFDLLTRFVRPVGGIIDAFDRLARNSRTGAAGIGVLRGAFNALLAPIQMIEDFLVFLAGGESLFGEWIDRAFGAGAQGTAQQWIDKALGGFFEITKALVGINDKMTAIGNTFTGIQSVARTFGIAKDLASGNVLGASKGVAELAGGNGFDIGSLRGALSAAQTLAVPFSGVAGASAALGAAGAMFTDNSTKSVVVQVGSTAEIAGAVQGAQRGMGRDAAASLAAVQ